MLAGKPEDPITHHPPIWWMALCYGGGFFALIAGIAAAILITD
jgi:hypothetical protein